MWNVFEVIKANESFIISSKRIVVTVLALILCSAVQILVEHHAKINIRNWVENSWRSLNVDAKRRHAYSMDT